MADGKETKPEQDQDHRKIPVFTVLKNGAILKNIFIVNNVSSFEKNEFRYQDDEDIIVIGRHPDCDIMLTHPSISRFHLQIHSIPFSQKIFVVDLSSVHGTWVSEKKIEPGARVEMCEGDTLRVGGSSRVYRLQWVPLIRAYDFETPSLSALGVSETEKKEDEDAILEEKASHHCEKDNSLFDESKEIQLQEEESIFDSIDPSCFNENWNVDMIKEIPSAPPLDEAEGVVMSLFDGGDIKSSPRNEIEQKEISRSRTMPFGNESKKLSMVDFLMPALVNEKQEPDDENESPLPISLPLSVENFSFNVEDVIMSSFFGGESQSPSKNKLEQMETSRFGTINFSKVDDGMPVSAVDNENKSPQQPHSPSLSEENLSFNVEDVIMSSFIVGEIKSQLTHKVEQMETSRLMTINLSMVEEEEPASVNGKQQYDIENESPQSHSLPLSSEKVSLNVEDIVLSSFFGGESKSPSRNKFEQIETSNIRTEPIENESTCLSMVHDEKHAPENGNQQYDNVDKSPQPHSMPLSEENLSINAENNSIFSFHGGECERPLRNKLEQKEVSSPTTITFRNESNNVAMVNDGKPISENGSQQFCNKNEEPHSMPIAAETLSLNVGVLAETQYHLVHKQEPSIKPLLPLQSQNTTEKIEFVVKKTLHPLEGDHSSISTEERKLEMGTLDKSQTTGSISKKDFEHREFSNLSVPCTMDFVCSFMKNDEVSSEIAVRKESHTPQFFSASAEVCQTQMLGTSPVRAQNTSAMLSIWSRRGKQASFPLVKTGVSGGNRKTSLKDELNHKMIGDEIDSNTHPSHWDGEEEEIFTPDKENFTPNTLLMKSLKKKGKIEESSHSKSCNSQSSIIKSSSKFNQENESSHGSDKENQTPKAIQERKLARHISKNIMRLKKEKTVLKRGAERAPFQSLQLNSAGKSAVINSGTKSNLSVSCTGAIKKNKFTRELEGKKHWTMVVDIGSLLNKESMKSLQLLQGLKGTHLIIPRTVIRELDCMRRHGSLFRRTTEASSVLQWIEDCMVKTRWWIHVQSSVEEGGLIAPTPRATTQSQYTEGGEGLFCKTAGSNYGSFIEILSPTTEDHILDSALRFRKLNDGQLAILSDDVTLKIKAMAEGLICETAKEFRESLVNPFSERFLWADSSPRGLTWSCSDDVVLMERYNNHCSLRSSKGEGAKGLKLILLHNSHYGRLG